MLRAVAFLLVTLLIGCARPAPPADQPPAQTPPATGAPAPGPAETPAPPATSDPNRLLADRAKEAVTALQGKDLTRLAALVHPEKGVRWSPYGYVRTEENGDLVSPAEKVGGLFQDGKVYTWGIFDGSGAPIEMTFTDYYQRFVYDRNFAAAPTVATNQIVGQGNTRVNLSEAYPSGGFVEYHFPGTQENAGHDWASLRLVFEQKDGQWYLVGVVHDQWTI